MVQHKGLLIRWHPEIVLLIMVVIEVCMRVVVVGGRKIRHIIIVVTAKVAWSQSMWVTLRVNMVCGIVVVDIVNNFYQKAVEIMIKNVQKYR